MKSLVSLFAALLSSLFAFAQQRPVPGAQEILNRYVEDFRHDPAAAASTGTFLIRVTGEGGGDWTVTVAKPEEGQTTAAVTLLKGPPAAPAWLYTLNLETLRRIDRGEINALTAMGKARESDPAPMDLDFMPGFQPDPDWVTRVLPLTFHFWTRGLPETIAFGKSYSREVHGANMVVFYYQQGLRSAWAMVEKGQHVNADPRDQSNRFPSMFIGIRGSLSMRLNGKERQLHGGEMLFVPAGMTHEAWNPNDEPAEAIVLMFGEGA